MAYASLSDIKSYLGIASITDDALLERLLGAATAYIERYTGRVFSAVAEERYFRRANKELLFLGDDLLSVTSIINGDGESIDTSLVYPVGVGYPTRVLVYGLLWVTHPAPVRIAGTWGYSTEPPGDIAAACIRLASWMYRQKDAQIFDVTGQADLLRLVVSPRVPSDVVAILNNYKVAEVLL